MFVNARTNPLWRVKNADGQLSVPSVPLLCSHSVPVSLHRKRSAKTNYAAFLAEVRDMAH